jgi:hypothetical protein
MASSTRVVDRYASSEACCCGEPGRIDGCRACGSPPALDGPDVFTVCCSTSENDAARASGCGREDGAIMLWRTLSSESIFISNLLKAARSESRVPTMFHYRLANIVHTRSTIRNFFAGIGAGLNVQDKSRLTECEGIIYLKGGPTPPSRFCRSPGKSCRCLQLQIKGRAFLREKNFRVAVPGAIPEA